MPQPPDESTPPYDASAKFITDVLLSTAALVATWAERHLDIQERIAVALEAKAGDVDHDAVFELLKEAYDDRYIGPPRTTAGIVREKYGARLKAALGRPRG